MHFTVISQINFPDYLNRANLFLETNISQIKLENIM